MATRSSLRRGGPAGSGTGCDSWRGRVGRDDSAAEAGSARKPAEIQGASAIVSRETYRSASNRTIPAGDSLQQWMMRRTNTGPATDHRRASAASLEADAETGGGGIDRELGREPAAPGWDPPPRPPAGDPPPADGHR